ncbi:hypothetical protein [Oceanimonas sp. CAM02]|uniref:hypothetical protein n=1 Tax=Oceanimonas sp. CAM02 TaxID=3080336 RepID=UPI0029364E15|nr:hypothetical protein [Oceanimonas sp. CAM02]MDV2856873.1 hypothetical protein [Oceanimonas sp. CAM02]
MSEIEIIKIVEEMLLAFGGAIALITALVTWLGVLLQKRILQKEQNALLHKLESYKQELSLAKSSYENYLDQILDYYNAYYKHYRLCQHACDADAHRHPDGSITFTQDDFDAGLDQFLLQWSEKEGRIRILLPEKILELHERSIDAFNEVKNAVEGFKKDHESRQKKHEAFARLDTVKTELEAAIRKFLRTEDLLK